MMLTTDSQIGMRSQTGLYSAGKKMPSIGCPLNDIQSLGSDKSLTGSSSLSSSSDSDSWTQTVPGKIQKSVLCSGRERNLVTEPDSKS